MMRFISNTVVIVNIVLVLSASLFASEDCNSIEPDWKLEGTNCSIEPYYYEVEMARYDEFDCQCTGDDYHDYSRSGTSKEYITGYHCHYGDNLPDYVYYYGCKEPEYSCDWSCYLDPESQCDDSHPRYGCWMFCLSCSPDFDSCTSEGSWQVPEGSQDGRATQFRRIFSFTDSGTHNGSNDWTREYLEELTITAIFDKPSDPNCYNKPQVRIDKYDSRVVVRAKDGDRCCESGSNQTIRISCNWASHIKNVQYTQNDGQLYTVQVENASDVDCCDENHHSSPSVKVTYRPRHGIIEFRENLEETVEVSCDFYDRAGNPCGSGKASITFTLGCPPPPEKG